MNKINSIKPNFGSRHLYTARLKKKLPIIPIEITKDVFISELDKSDKDRLFYEKDKWKGTRYGESIIEDYFGELHGKYPCKFFFSKYFVIEDTKGNIKGLALTEIRESHVELALIQSEREKKKRCSTQGVGTCLLYSASKLAQNLKMNCITIRAIPEAIEFYIKAGIQQIGPSDFVIKKENFEKFYQNIEKKYSILPIEEN